MEPHWHIRGSKLLERWTSDFRAYGRLRRWGHRAEIDHPEVGNVQLIIAGSIQVQGPNGLVRLDRGDLWGVNENGLSLRAVDDTTVLDLGHEHLGESLGEMEARVGVIKPRTLSMPVRDLIRYAEEDRVIKVLLHVAPNLIAAQRVELEIRARHVSQLTGLPLARTQSILDQLQRSKLVEVGRRGLVIPDLAAIHALLQVDP